MFNRLSLRDYFRVDLFFEPCFFNVAENPRKMTSIVGRNDETTQPENRVGVVLGIMPRDECPIVAELVEVA